LEEEMKKILSFMLVMFMLLALVACAGGDGNSQNTEETGKNPFAYYVMVGSQKVELGAAADAVISALGEPRSVQDMGGCAGIGSTFKYLYDNVEIYVIENEKGKFIDGMKLLNDLVSDSKGVSIGDTVQDFSAAYGGAISSGDGQKNFSAAFDAPYTDKTAKKVVFYTVQDGAVSAIEYRIVVENQ
jgi:hypothetical protein